MWGGRFVNKCSNKDMKRFNSSIEVDRRLFHEDIQGSKAYAKAQFEIGFLSRDEYDQIHSGLEKVLKEWNSGTFVIREDDEDVHTANERRLKELVGAIGGTLHTGRSRNDQVCTDMLLWLKSSLKLFGKHLADLMTILVERAESEMEIIMPGYTHLQRAQPIRWSQWLLSYAAMFERDLTRMNFIELSIDTCPLGSGALAGNILCLKRDKLATDLGFTKASSNSLDSVGNRDFVAEFLFWASLFSIHCSRLAEDLIIFSSQEFNYVQLSDQYCTGSSLMPQKKNPDSMELIRGKSGTILGKCFGFLATLKGLPGSYNKDFQEDKEVMFSAHDILLSTIEILKGVFLTLKINDKACAAALSADLLATDVAYYLTNRGVGFRDAHVIVGKCVVAASESGASLLNLPLDILKSISPYFDHDVYEVWNFERSVEQYKAEGGTSRSAIFKQIEYFKKVLQDKC